MSRDLAVSLYDEHIGTLTRRPGGGSAFVADADWIAHRFRPMLGLSWLQDTQTRWSAEASLPVWFENLLPELDSALRQRIAVSLGVRPDDSFRLIEEVGTDLPGAVVVVPQRDESDADIAEPLPSLSRESDPLRFSLAGMQLKFSLTLREGRLTLPVRGEQGTWIAKLPSERLSALPAVECLTMDWARASELDAAEAKLVEVAGIDEIASLARFETETCLLVRRFDRTSEGPIHQEDLAQSLTVAGWNKYTDRQGPRMTGEGLVRFVRDACGDDAGRDMVRRLAFVLASGNTDAHLKNWSLRLPRHGRPELAPLYDQVSTIAWGAYGWRRPGGPEFAMPIGGRDTMSSFDREALRAFADRVGDGSCVDTFIDTLARARDAWSSLRDRATSPHRAAIAEHWRRVPLLAELGGVSD